MEKKPIKRSKYIIQLSKDHHFTLLFCWKIRMGLKHEVDTNRIGKYVEYFWAQHIQPHFYGEETFLFTPVKDNAVQKALGEHAEIRRQINAIITSENIQVAQLESLANIIESHVRYEERELFPHLEKILTENQLKQIEKELLNTHAAVCKDEFSDGFWIKK